VRNTLVVGNWKLNGSKDSVTELLKNILNGLSDESQKTGLEKATQVAH